MHQGFRFICIFFPLALTGCMTWPSERFLQAAGAGDTYRLEALSMENQIDVNVRDADGRTALMLASMNGQLEALDWLIGSGADPMLVDHEGWHALMLAGAHGHRKLASRLIDLGLPVDHANRYGNTTLHWCAAEGRKELTALLLENGANPYLVNDLGWTPAAVAERAGFPDIVTLLSSFQDRRLRQGAARPKSGH